MFKKWAEFCDKCITCHDCYLKKAMLMIKIKCTVFCASMQSYYLIRRLRKLKVSKNKGFFVGLLSSIKKLL